mgnify:CR=1 FL=1
MKAEAGGHNDFRGKRLHIVIQRGLNAAGSAAAGCQDGLRFGRVLPPPYHPVSQSITRPMALEQTGQKRTMVRVNTMQSVVGR